MKLIHKDLKALSEKIAAEKYEIFARDDSFYKHYPDQKVYVQYEWQNSIEDAKQLLLQIVCGNYSDAERDAAREILYLNATLPKGTANPLSESNIIH